MIIPINWLNYYVTIYQCMKMTYHNHDMEDYIDYHDIRYILHITTNNLCCKSSMAWLMARGILVNPTHCNDVNSLFSVVCGEPNAIL